MRVKLYFLKNRSLISSLVITVKDYIYLYFDLDSKKNLKKLLKQQGLFIAEGMYNGNRRLGIPMDNIVEIFLGVTLGKRTNTNELTYV